MRRSVALLCLVPLGAQAGDLTFYEKSIASAADCHKTYEQVVPDWRRNRAALFTRFPDGRERLIHCLPDGVAEWICVPAAGKIYTAVQIGKTLAACEAQTPKVPMLDKPSMFAP